MQETIARNRRKTAVGIVTSDKMDKTISVSIERKVPHPGYRRVIRVTSTLKAHDANNECRVGDKVKVMATRPLSKSKRWRLVEVLEKAK
jgi:small subunit ribosomal protein S17